MTPVRDRRWSAMTTNLPALMADVAALVHEQSDAGERYAVEIHIVGPLTVEESVTALWGRVRVVQIPVT